MFGVRSVGTVTILMLTLDVFLMTKTQDCGGTRCETSLVCTHSNISSLTINCTNKANVKVLRVDYNCIRVVNDFVNQLTNLEDLSINHNHLEAINTLNFKSLSKLEYLKAAHNNLKWLSSNICLHATNLRYVDFKNNQLTRIQLETFVRCRILWVIDLSNNKIIEIHEKSFPTNASLKRLICNDNRLQNLMFLKHLTGLKDLNLSNNNISTINANTFNSNTKLEHIDLSYNKVRQLSTGTLDMLSNLKRLNLSHNRFVYLGESHIISLNNLKMFDLEDNNLEDFVISRRNNSALKILLNGNRWKCKFIRILFEIPFIEVEFEKNDTVSNVNGMPCIDEIMYRTIVETKPETISIKTTTTSTTTTATKTTTTTTSTTTVAIALRNLINVEDNYTTFTPITTPKSPLVQQSSVLETILIVATVLLFIVCMVLALVVYLLCKKPDCSLRSFKIAGSGRSSDNVNDHIYDEPKCPQITENIYERIHEFQTRRSSSPLSETHRNSCSHNFRHGEHMQSIPLNVVSNNHPPATYGDDYSI